MKYLCAIIGLILWGLFTIILAISLMGWVVLCNSDSWEEIPIKLLRVFEK